MVKRIRSIYDRIMMRFLENRDKPKAPTDLTWLYYLLMFIALGMGLVAVWIMYEWIVKLGIYLVKLL